MRAASINAIKRCFVAGYPLILIETYEEEQVTAVLANMATTAFHQAALPTWDLQQGLIVGATALPNTLEPAAALDYLAEDGTPGLFVFKDLTPLLAEHPELVRRLRNICQTWRGRNRFLIMLHHEAVGLPEEIKKELQVVRFNLPDPPAIREIVERYFENLRRRNITVELSPEQQTRAVISLQGLTSHEIFHALNKFCTGQAKIDGSILDGLHREKEQLTRKEGILEYVPPTYALDDVGGLGTLKAWLKKRHKLFSPEARAAGLNAPKGILMMGISGCGKSLAVKAISTLWDLPLFRLDMNQVYSGTFGSPESTFHRAIHIMEAVAPAVLWIDEIEAGISGQNLKEGGVSSRIFGAFLTWMQEKSASVFVAATANRIDLLPAEIIRKGRFDQVFFVDLPNDDEREEILRVHLQRRGNDPTQFDLGLLSVATEFWNGAELEHCVEAAMIEAFSQDRKMSQDDLYGIIRSTVPLSRTMAEQIKYIKNWAAERAVSASEKSA